MTTRAKIQAELVREDTHPELFEEGERYIFHCTECGKRGFGRALRFRKVFEKLHECSKD